MVEERDLIEDWQQGRLIPEEVPLEVVDSLAALSRQPLSADPNLGMMRMAQRIDELIQLVGRMAHSDLTTIPAATYPPAISQPQPNTYNKQSKR